MSTTEANIFRDLPFSGPNNEAFVLPMKDLPAIHRRALEAFMQRRGLNTYNWASRAGIDESSLRQFLKGKGTKNPVLSDSMRYLHLARLAEAEGVTVAEMMGETLPRDAAMGTIAIPWLMASGELDGSFVVGPDRTRSPYRMPRQDVDSVLFGEPKRGLFFEADTDAMAPDIRRGDSLCIDTMAVTTTNEQRYYCVWNGKAPQIAALVSMPRDRLRFMAETTTASTVEYDSSSIDIIGRVVWRAGTI